MARPAAKVLGGIVGTCLVSCVPGWGDDCRGSAEPGSYTLHLSGSLPSPGAGGAASGPCLNELAVGMTLNLSITEGPDCRRKFRLESALPELASFVEDPDELLGGISAVYRATTVSGCRGVWRGIVYPPPPAPSEGVPCDDCAILIRYFEPELCSFPVAACEDRFYGPLVRVP